MEYNIICLNYLGNIILKSAPKQNVAKTNRTVAGRKQPVGAIYEADIGKSNAEVGREVSRRPGNYKLPLEPGPFHSHLSGP